MLCLNRRSIVIQEHSSPMYKPSFLHFGHFFTEWGRGGQSGIVPNIPIPLIAPRCYIHLRWRFSYLFGLFNWTTVRKPRAIPLLCNNTIRLFCGIIFILHLRLAVCWRFFVNIIHGQMRLRVTACNEFILPYSIFGSALDCFRLFQSSNF